MPALEFTAQNHLPSVWAEARTAISLRNEEQNVSQVINRADAEALVHSSTLGPIRNYSEERTATMLANQVGATNYIAPANNIYNIHAQPTYNPIVNPVIVDRVV